VRAAAAISLLVPMLGATVALAAARPAPAPLVSRATVEARLRAYQPDPAAWRALGPGVDELLIAIGGDGKMEVLVRSRALSTLAYFPTAASRKFLEATIEAKASSSDPGDRLLVRRAAVALGWLGGLRVPARLAPLLDSQDPEVRLDAAIGLGLTRLPAAADSLRKRLDVETAPQVRAQLSRQLQTIESTISSTRAKRAGRSGGGTPSP
jgi:HEAT repeat protein